LKKADRHADNAGKETANRRGNAMARKATGRKAPGRKATTAKTAGKKATTEPRGKAAATKPRTVAKTASAKAKKSAAPAARGENRKAEPRKAPPARMAPGKAATKSPTRKTTPAKAPARKTAAPKPAARVATTARSTVARGRSPAAPSRKLATPAVRLKAAAGPQRFTVSHLNEADFQRDGLRPYALYRELGIAAATNGLCQAHVIRLIPPCTDEARKRHVHATELQLIYVLKGWMKNEFEGHGEQMMSAGSCWLQPPGIKHTVLDYSADCEVLEIIVPADFKTVETD
jgi:uncharacterized RmlC-like cupin family protein